MPLTKHSSPSSPSSRSRNSPQPSRSREGRHSSSGGFHPFGGKLSKHFGDSLSPEDAYLSYHDIRLTRSDITTIKSDWLTDNAIAFWEEYLEREKLPHYPAARIVLLRPSMSFLLQKTPSQEVPGLKSALPDFSSASHVFLPVNDCRAVDQAEGGSHWSLLLVSVLDGVAFHYDSLSPSNTPEAQSTTHRLSTLLSKPLRFINITETPQQENGKDCGVYVCLLMQYLLLQRLLTAKADEKMNMSLRGKELDAKGMRGEILRVIEARRDEGERRRSRSFSPAVKGSRSRGRESPPRVGTENA